MSTLLRKVWESVSNRPGSSSSSSNPNFDSIPDSFRQMMYLQTSSTGEFDRIPLDILIQILKFLGPKESAKLSAVCKSWNFIVSDNRLWVYFLQNQQEPWDSIFFGETQLRSGYPLQTFPSQMPDLSFMRIYAHRTQVPGAIIIDGGSGYCKFGWSKYGAPSGRSATFLEFGNIESPMYSRLRHFFSTIYSRMQVKTSAQPIVLSIPICHTDDTESDAAARRQLCESIHNALFDMHVPAVCAIDQAVLALFAARRTCGIVVNIGFNQTSVVPILHGKVMHKVGVEVVGMGALKIPHTAFSLFLHGKVMHKVGVEVVGMGALKLTGFLREKMQQKNMDFKSLYTVRTLKENLCYVALDYKAELQKNTEATFQTAEGQFTLSKERFQTGEVLFQPQIAGLQMMSLHNAVALCMDHCQDAELTGDDSWFKTVVLAGGSACLPGLAERLEQELHGAFPQSMSSGIRVIPPPYGADSAWYGAKLISNLSTFPGSWCITKKHFRHNRNRRTLLHW